MVSGGDTVMRKFFAGILGHKALFLACIVVTSAAYWCSLVTLERWDTLWFGGYYIGSDSVYEAMAGYQQQAEQIRDLLQQKRWGESLSYADQQRLDTLEQGISPEQTNYRVEIHNQEGQLLYSNLPDGESMSSVSAVRLTEDTVSKGEELVRHDYNVYNGELEYKMVCLDVESRDYIRCDPRDVPGQYNPYGWLSDGKKWKEYKADMDTRVSWVTLTTQSGVEWPLTVKDAFSEDYSGYLQVQRYLPWIAGLAALTIALSIWLMEELCRVAGRRAGREEIFRSRQDRVPLDLYLAFFALAVKVLLDAGEAAAWGLSQGDHQKTPVVGLAVFTLLTSGLCLSLLHTLAVRIKAKELLRNTLIWRLFVFLGKFFRNVAAHWQVTKRPILTFLLYLIGTAATAFTLVLAPVYQGVALWLICRWARQWRTVREGTEHIVKGEPGYQIDNTRMYRDLRQHADQLNDLGAAIGSAVDERLRSERFKTELITNVSHDLKTPLTSIISYVGLLKKTGIQDPHALEYIDVLDRKSQRLKKLTEDLIEASKASSGTLPVHLERLGLTQLVEQALGEYEEKFESGGLIPSFTTPGREVWVKADGRHLWRVVDNLLSNCIKYALPGTRVYLDVKAEEGNAVLTVKNISREPLNISPDRLLERFVRGDEARTEEGSGLGLSITRSLTELQGGSFRLEIDGDLFKAIVSVPEELGSTPATLPGKMPKEGDRIRGSQG